MNLTASPRVSISARRGSRNGLWSVAALLMLAIVLVASPVYAGAMSTGGDATIMNAEGTMTVDGGTPWAIPMAQDPNSGLWGVGSWDSNLQDFTGFEFGTEAVEGFHVQISGVLNPDPIVSYGIAVTDFGAPSLFGFFFLSPIVVAPGPTVVDSSVSGAVTDLTGDGVTITPTGPLLQSSAVGLPVTPMGVDIGPAYAGAPGPPATDTYGPYAAGPIAGPAGPWTTMSVTVGFGLSGGGDSAVLTGFAQIVEFIPEPSTYVMLAMGIAGVGLFARRRRK